MVAIIAGLSLMAFTVIACLSSGLNWSKEIIMVLKGFTPCLAGFIGLIAVFIGFADIKDKKEAEKEEAAAKKAEESAAKKDN